MQENKKQDPVILPLTIDGIFKLYFENPRNLPELRRFLRAYLEISDDDLSTIQVLNPGLLKDDISEKGFTVDLLLKTKSGNALHIEMQTSEHTNYKERFQLYNARKAGQQIKVGEKYSKVRRTISLIVTDFPVFDDSEKSHERIVMRRENGKIFTNVQELNFIDLTKTETDEENNKEKYLWGKLFKVETWEDLKLIAKESKEMEEAADKLLQVSADERAQAYAFSREGSEFARRLHEQGIRDEAEERVRKETEVEKAELIHQVEQVKEEKAELIHQVKQVKEEKAELIHQVKQVKEEKAELIHQVEEEKAELVQQVEAKHMKQVAKKQIASAQEMIKDNFSIEKIEKYTGLSVKKIKELL